MASPQILCSWNPKITAMSTLYVLEPPTKGKVVLKTTHGPLDIELWPKEAPKAVRNFVQLCLEGYYDKTIFHRIIRDFMVQGGDPTGTGSGWHTSWSCFICVNVCVFVREMVNCILGFVMECVFCLFFMF